MKKTYYSLQAINLYQEKKHAIQPEIISSLDFITFCDEHRILSRMEKIIRPHLKSKELIEIFYEKINRNKQRSLRQLSLLLKIAKKLNEQFLPWLSFKGPVLSYHLLQDAALRSSKDLDIWVKKGDVLRAHEILTQIGFEVDDEILTMSRRLPNILNKDRVYYHSTMDVQLELHWILIPGAKFTDQLILEHMKTLVLNEEKIPVFAPEIEFIYLCAHAAKSHFPRLSWWFDLYDYTKIMQLDMKKIEKISKENDLHLFVIHSLEVLNAFFETDFKIDNKFIILKNTIRRKKRHIIFCQEFSIASKLMNYLDDAILAKNINLFLFAFMTGIRNKWMKLKDILTFKK